MARLIALTLFLVAHFAPTLTLASLTPPTAFHRVHIRAHNPPSQPVPALNSSAPKSSYKINADKASRYTVGDTKARVAQLNSQRSTFLAASPPPAGSGGEFFNELLEGLAALDFPLNPNKDKTLDPNSNGVPKLLRPKNNNYTLQAAFAEVAYCLKDFGLRGCGIACKSIPADTKIVYESGDGELNPKTYVAVTPSKRLITVAHQGTNTSSFPSLFNDALFIPLPLLPQLTPDPSLPNLPLTISSLGALAHIGFQATFARAYDGVLKSVKKQLAGKAKGYEVLVVGHSLGAAVAQLTAVALRNDLTKEEAPKLRVTAFEAPRTGNVAFANYMNELLGDNQVHFTNQEDPVPHLPPQIALGFAPKNEFFFSSSDPKSLRYCPGQENQNCIAGRKGSKFEDHLGPLFGIKFNIDNCKYGL